MEIIEEDISGFCRMCNQGRTVTCEYEEENGQRKFLQADCMYEKCDHKGSCLIAKQIRDFTKTLQ